MIRWLRRKTNRCEECGETLGPDGVCPTVRAQRDKYDERFAEFVRTGEKWRKPIRDRP